MSRSVKREAFHPCCHDRHRREGAHGGVEAIACLIRRRCPPRTRDGRRRGGPQFGKEGSHRLVTRRVGVIGARRGRQRLNTGGNLCHLRRRRVVTAHDLIAVQEQHCPVGLHLVCRNSDILSSAHLSYPSQAHVRVLP